MKPLCAFTGRVADNGHHATGRGADGRYLDPYLVVPLARGMHVVEHQAWRRLGIDDPEMIAPAILRLRRSGHLWFRLGAHHGSGVVTLPATSVLAHGAMLNDVADELAGDA